MNNDNKRIRTSVSVGGLDTSSPDRMVKDGMMEQLHNLRNSGGTWRNVRPFERHEFRIPASMQGFEIIYQHPAAPDDEYIASRTNDDGTIDLFQVILDREKNIMLPRQIEIYPIYVVHKYTILGNNVHIESFYPVPVQVTVVFNKQTSTPISLTIPQGETASRSSTRIDLNLPYFFDDEMLNDGTISSFRLYPDVQEAAEASMPGPFARNRASIIINHIGNILLTTDTQNTDYFLLKDNVYTRINIPSPPLVSQTSAYFNIPMTRRTLLSNINDEYYILPIYNAATDTYLLSQEFGSGYWHGEICCFVAWEMFDGTIVAPSAILLFASELDNCTEEARKIIIPSPRAGGGGTIGEHIIYRNNQCVYYMKKYDSDLNAEFFICNYTSDSGDIGTLNIAIMPTIDIRLPETPNKDIFKRAVVFSTRIHPMYDSEKMKHLYLSELPAASSGLVDTYITKIYADNKLPEQPFYKIKEIDIEDFIENQYTLVLTHELLKDIELNTTYVPEQSIHSISYSLAKEYNERLHVANVDTTLFEGYSDGIIQSYEDNTANGIIATTLNISKDAYTTHVKFQYGVAKFGKLAVYPDYRAHALQVFEGDMQLLSVNLKPATGNNIAYKYRFADEYETIKNPFGPRPEYIGDIYVKYPCFNIIREGKSIPETNNKIRSRNKLLVSAPNNPLSFPLANTYAIGSDSNRIFAINSAAIEMSDAKFGEFPLYVFTEEGIYSLQTGSGEVLYSAVLPINYDRIINPETLAVNYNIIYITERGVHAMFSNRSTLISAPIHDMENRPRLDFLRTAQMYYQYTQGEIILFNPDVRNPSGPYLCTACVFSLDNKTWSTRDFHGAKLDSDRTILNGKTEVIIENINNEVPIISHPDEGISICFISRPIKLGSMEFKRLETLIPRWIYGDSSCPQVDIEGSTDLVTWIPLRQIAAEARYNHELIIRRTPRSFRYLRITVTHTVQSDFELSSFDIEYYLRFIHRLR